MNNNNPCPATYLKCDEGFCTCRREKKISSIDWLVKELKLEGYNYTVEQAKAMHKEETLKLYNEYQDYLDYEFKNQLGGQSVIKSFEQYYNETYGGNK